MKGYIKVCVNVIPEIERHSFKQSREMESKVTPTLCLRISVNDTGIGIKEEDQKKLFKFFGKVGEKIDEINPQGIGLGLTICNKILA